MPVKTYLQAISEALREEMRRDERVFMIGEDIGVYGGAFKVTDGFPAEFGPWRVHRHADRRDGDRRRLHRRLDGGLRPVAEMQFADFISCGYDQIVDRRRDAALPHRHAAAVRRALPVRRRLLGRAVPLAEPRADVRALPGAARSSCPATPEDAKGLMQAAIRDDNPVIYFEHKRLYRRIKGEVPEDGDGRDPARAGARASAQGSDVTVVT